MLQKPNLQNLIPLTPLLDPKILEYEAANQGFMDKLLLNKKTFEYMAYTFAYSQINKQFEGVNDEFVDKAKACFRVLIASLMKTEFEEWNEMKQKHFTEIAMQEFEIITAMHHEEITERNELDEDFTTVRSIKKALDNKGYKDEVSTGWNELSNQAWGQMVTIIEEDKEDQNTSRSEETWFRIVETATTLN